ncbi:hypothetical protein O9K51_03456 [Purpureocillium lavendulum]|uniref:Xylanolytic transcriptional activator regulatory domain-containing protein n=1 Tax=Purpureocillium lavendulum TaxID=1247861 RepID=A0AB34G1P5_9HYPO|nr:hypothetical protein O9K51_03456 [Purpureocillium lavendulum]
MGEDGALLDLYYERFHCSHPFVLPRPALHAKLATGSPTLRALVDAMQNIGSSYAEAPMRRFTAAQIHDNAVVDGFVVQTTLLLALVKSMCAERAASDALLTTAISQAKSIGMHTRGFADDVANSDPVLAESWRRTWWMLYVTDLNFAVIRYDFNAIISDLEHNVDLPCEDIQYALLKGPQTLASFDEYRNREYALDSPSYSSFAYFIDATRIFVDSLRAATQYESIHKAELLCGDLEAAVGGWFVMLPNEKRELATQPVVLDQLMFQAHMMMYTSLAYIHRPLSSLGYDPAEDLSSCGTPPPPLISSTAMGHAFNHRIHSQKLFQAVRKQNQCLILLPLGTAQLSPFLICMVACCTIAHLVACKSAFTPEEANVARSRIRVCLGTLKHYEDVWPRARKILRELRIVAQIIMKGPTTSPPVSTGLDTLTEQDIAFASFFDREWLEALQSPT